MKRLRTEPFKRPWREFIRKLDADHQLPELLTRIAIDMPAGNLARRAWAKARDEFVDCWQADRADPEARKLLFQLGKVQRARRAEARHGLRVEPLPAERANWTEPVQRELFG